MRSSADISTLGEARSYYAEYLVGQQVIECHGRPVTVFFERSATHLFSEEAPSGDALPAHERVMQRVKGGRVEERRFSLDRARLMDRVIDAISHFTVSVPGTGVRGHEKRMLHGPRLPDGRYLRVVLRPGGPGDFVCVSAYPVSEAVWLAMRRSKSAKFPP